MRMGIDRAARWLLILCLAGCSRPAAVEAPVFVTDYGLGPDKWATAWLLTRHVTPGAKLEVVPMGQPLVEGVAFDAPSATLRRQRDRTTFEVASQAHGVTDPVVLEMARLVHDIEVNFWGPDEVPQAGPVEDAFRRLQFTEGRDAVSPDCYVEFFDGVYRALRDHRRDGRPISAESLAVDCQAIERRLASEDRLVPELALQTLVEEMRRGKRVVFVDVREPDEFAEGRIPGARNMTLRDLDPAFVESVKSADYVVSYCVKDFRGFEMAKALRLAGVENSVILKPYGIKGWVAAGLPTAGDRTLDEATALARLERCLRGEEPGCGPLANREDA